ncbi:MAG: cbb3-type cytochrome c oxidase subunit I [Desulfurococcales archaeon]|nr:cbb3-type cytochrome c oxidase subunit I [Desulfurococcales archaeon]
MPQYEGQKLAMPFVLVALLLFLVQLIAGGLMALYYISPETMSKIVQFNVLRAYHINALVFWLFAATFAGVIYAVPVLSGRDLWGHNLVRVVALLMIIGVVGAFATFPLMQSGRNVWFLGQPMLYEGKEYVEAGRLWDIIIFTAFLLFAIVVLKSLPPMRQWPLALWGLVFGAALTFFLYIPGNYFFKAVPTSEYFRWWTVHYWVEGALEVAYVSAFGLILMVLIPTEDMRRVVDKYVFYDIVLAATSGIIGQGHHYFWIGTPDFWILLGGVFSSLEIIPLILLSIEAVRIAKESGVRFANIPSLYFMVGTLVFGFIGVSMLGFIQTLPWTNWWEHGTWVTPIHGHECMMAFAMGAITLILFAIPDLTGKPADRTFTAWGKRAFWLMFIGQIILATSFGLGGVRQIFHYWILGEPWQNILSVRYPFVAGLVVGGAIVFIGVLHLVAAVFRHLYFPVDSEPYEPSSKPRRSFLTTFDGIPFLVGLSVLLALIGATGLWSFSAKAVLSSRDPWLPYSLSVVAYLGLGVLAVILASKYARTLEYGLHIEEDKAS